MTAKYQIIAEETGVILAQTNCEEIADTLARKYEFRGHDIKIEMLHEFALWPNPQTLYLTVYTTQTDWIS